jgi:hypothetical protein
MREKERRDCVWYEKQGKRGGGRGEREITQLDMKLT